MNVPPGERQAYAGHVAGVLASLAPVGYLEERLAERVAMTLWRMRRLDAWEGCVIANQQAAIPLRVADRDYAIPGLRSLSEDIGRLTRDNPDHYIGKPDDLAQLCAETKAEGEAVLGLPNPPTVAAMSAITSNAMHGLVYAFLDELDAVPNEAIARHVLGGKPTAEDVYGLEKSLWDWEPEQAVRLWAFVDKQGGAEARGLAMRFAIPEIHRGVAMLAVADRIRGIIEREQGTAMLLDEHSMGKLQRYDGHLERALYKALHELEAMQERRRGGATPLARVEVHGGEGLAGMGRGE